MLSPSACKLNVRIVQYFYCAKRCTCSCYFPAAGAGCDALSLGTVQPAVRAGHPSAWRCCRGQAGGSARLPVRPLPTAFRARCARGDSREPCCRRDLSFPRVPDRPCPSASTAGICLPTPPRASVVPIRTQVCRDSMSPTGSSGSSRGEGTVLMDTPAPAPVQPPLLQVLRPSRGLAGALPAPLGVKQAVP